MLTVDSPADEEASLIKRVRMEFVAVALCLTLIRPMPPISQPSPENAEAQTFCMSPTHFHLFESSTATGKKERV